MELEISVLNNISQLQNTNTICYSSCVESRNNSQSEVKILITRSWKREGFGCSGLSLHLWCCHPMSISLSSRISSAKQFPNAPWKAVKNGPNVSPCDSCWKPLIKFWSLFQHDLPPIFMAIQKIKWLWNIFLSLSLAFQVRKL